MPGELDIDCVLACSALKAAQRDLFAVVADDLELFQFGLNDPLQMHANRHRPKHAVEEVVEKLRAGLTPNARVACETVLRYLFTAFRACETSGKHIAQPQAVDVVRHVDYARRFLSQAPPSAESSDQSALRSIKAWLAGRESDLIDRVMDPKRCAQVENFVGMFSPSDLLRFLAQLAERLSLTSAASWHEAAGPGIASVRQMLTARPPTTTDADRLVWELVERYATTHLPLAQCIGQLFAEGRSSVTPLLSPEGRQQVVQCLAKILPMHFTAADGAERLLEALKDGSPWLVFWLAWGYERNLNDDFNGLPFPEWPTFSSVLLNICESRPEIGVPLIVPFVTDRAIAHGQPASDFNMPDEPIPWRVTFNATRVTILFDRQRLLPLLRAATTSDDLDPQMNLSISAARDAAKEILSRPSADAGGSATDSGGGLGAATPEV